MWTDKTFPCRSLTPGGAAVTSCENCCNTYGLSNLIDGQNWIDECKSHSLSIAPIPTPVLNAWRQYNATHPASAAPRQTDKPYSFDIYSGGAGGTSGADTASDKASAAATGASGAMPTATSGSSETGGMSTIDGFAGQTGTGGAAGAMPSATAAATSSRNAGAAGVRAAEAGWFTGLLGSIMLALFAL